jgi:hypothetical protein
MRFVTRISITSLSLLLAVAAQATSVGDRAPEFTAVDSHGKTHSLAEYRGKFVVLEWTNNGCPYTRKHYESGNMQGLQQQWTAKGVVWLTVLSSAQGSQGYMTGAEGECVSYEGACGADGGAAGSAGDGWAAV